MRARPYSPAIRIRESAPVALPGAELIEKAENLAAREILMRATEQIEKIPTTRSDITPRRPQEVKDDALNVLRRLRDEISPGKDQQ